MDMEVAQPAVHEDAAEGDEHAGNLEMQAAFRVRWRVRVLLYEPRTVVVRHTAAA